MKRPLVALIAVGLVFAAITIARAHSGEQDAPEARPTPSTATPTTPVDEQVEQQSEQVLKAQAQLAEEVDKVAEDLHSHTLIVMIREERPGTVWVVREVDGEPTCVTPAKDAPTMIRVAAGGEPDAELTTKIAPLEADLTRDGACETSLELVVPQMERYDITVTGPGRGKFGRTPVRTEGEPQSVILVG